MSQIFIIGATGHIGGAVLHKIHEAYPSVTIKVLVRDDAKASLLTAKYPKVQCIIGDLASLDVIEPACREAEIVINTAPDITHDKSIAAILDALKSRATKGYYIHTAGGSLIWDEPAGKLNARVYDDTADVEELISFDDSKTHSVTDKIVRAAWPEVNTAIIAPGWVGGLSPSISHPTPITAPFYILTARAFKSGFQIGPGENTASWIHVLDLASMYTLLVENALSSTQQSESSPATSLWGPRAFYWGAAEELSFKDFMARLAPVLRGLGVIESTEVRAADVAEVARKSLGGGDDDDAAPPPPDSWATHIAIGYGINMRLEPSRMRGLGWKPEQGPIVESFEDVFSTYLRLEKEKEKEKEKVEGEKTALLNNQL